MSVKLDSLPVFFADVCTKIHAECFDEPWGQKDFETLLALPTTKGIILTEGFILCCVLPDEIEILTFCILPEFRKQGKGIFLIKQVQQYALQQKIPSIFLEVSAENQPAISLYKKMGFEQFAVRPKYYHHTTDALCLKYCPTF